MLRARRRAAVGERRATVAICCNAALGAQKPKILFLLSDDHSYPFLSCYGDSNVKTPTLNRLAKTEHRDGVYFLPRAS